MRAGTGIDTAVVGVLLVDCTLTHGGNEDGEVGLVEKLVDLVDNTVADGASIDKDDRVLGGSESVEYLVDDKVFTLGVVLGLRHVNRSLKASTLDLGLNHVGGKHDVDGARADPAISESSIDLLSNLGGLVQLSDIARDLRADVGKDVKVAISESVVEEQAVSLRDGGRAANDVNNGDVLRVGTGKTVEGRQLTNTKSGDEGSNLGDTGVAISGVG